MYIVVEVCCLIDDTRSECLFTQIEFCCIVQNPAMRPQMSSVVKRLESIQEKGLDKAWDVAEHPKKEGFFSRMAHKMKPTDHKDIY